MSINDLSVDILSKIFIHATRANQVYVGDGTQSRDRYVQNIAWDASPLNLVHVCQHWRTIALSLEPLWTSFASGGQSTFGTMGYFLSASWPANVHLALVPTPDSKSNQAALTLTDAFELFCQFSDRWDSMFLSLEGVDFNDEIEELLLDEDVRQSPVRRIEVCADRSTPSNTINQVVSTISAFPSLQDFSWTFKTFYEYDLRSSLHVVQWNSLETIHIESGFSLKDALWCLTQCETAKSATLIGTWYFTRDDSGIPQCRMPTTLPNLLSLKIVHRLTDPGWFLQHFTLPSLTFLEVHPLRERVIPVINDFFIRSQCPLDHLIIELACGCSMTDADLCSMLVYPMERNVKISWPHSELLHFNLVDNDIYAQRWNPAASSHDP